MVGRPTKYKPEYAKQAEVLCRLGATDQNLAEAFGVAESTINEWKKDHADFSESVKAKELSDALVEQSLFKRATGYARTIERVGKDGVVACVEEMPPDPTSMIFWLKNRQPSKWRDKQEMEHTGNPIAVINVGQKPEQK